MVSSRRNIIWTENAHQEAKAIFEFYNKRNGNSHYSRVQKESFKDAAKQASIFHLSGHATEYPHVRYIVVMPHYSMFYHFNDKTITVLVLWDNRREPSRLAYALRNCAPHYLNEAAVSYGKE